MALATGVLLGRVCQRLAELNRDLGEAEALPATDALGTVDRDRDHRHPGFQGETADARLRVAELAAAGAAALDVDQDQAALAEDRLGGDERLQVAVAAADREDAAVEEDELDHRVLEQLRFGHEADRPAQVDAGEEMVPGAEVVGGEDHRPLLGDVADADPPGAEEEDRRQGEDEAGEPIDPVRFALAGALVEAREVLRGAGVLVDLWSDLGHRDVRRPWPAQLPTPGAARGYARVCASAWRQPASSDSRSSSPIPGS